jgi:N-dimethylarginine dimethylaminohydrolase
MYKGECEFNRKPDLVITHNPYSFGMKDYFDAIPIDGNIRRLCLFREIPHSKEFNKEHNEYIAKLSKYVKVVNLADLLKSDDIDRYRGVMEQNPNFVYTRDSLIMFPWLPSKYILCKMGSSIREKETAVMKLAAKELELEELFVLPDGYCLEGGDVIPFTYDGKRVLLIGYGIRTTKNTLSLLKERLIDRGLVDEIIGFSLATWRINLDGGFVPVSDKIAISHTESILEGVHIDAKRTTDINPIHFFESIGYTILKTDKLDSELRQTCNCFCDGNGTIFAYNLKPDFYKPLIENGLNVELVGGTELVKGTGGPRCMTRPIYL